LKVWPGSKGKDKKKREKNQPENNKSEGNHHTNLP